MELPRFCNKPSKSILLKHNFITVLTHCVTKTKRDVCLVVVISIVNDKISAIVAGTIDDIAIVVTTAPLIRQQIPTWISNYIHYKVWDEITYPFLNFNGGTVEV